ncbi:Transcription factor [Coemansia sp. Benny D115]|nr:Transcription factor [Coemansia sp. Benny D115]
MSTQKRKTSKLALEPNPFEHSFSLVRPEDVSAKTLVIDEDSEKSSSGLQSLSLQSAGSSASAHAASTWAETADTPRSALAQEMGDQQKQKQKQQQQQQRPSSTPAGSASSALSLLSEASDIQQKQEREQDLERQKQKVTLPPAAAISGELVSTDMSHVWGPESLRSGPLSPAMLGAPATATAKPAPRITPRLGITEPMLHTGLTPFISGEVQPTIASGAFGPLKLPSALATPGIQAIIKAAIEGQEITATPGGSLKIASAVDSTYKQPHAIPMASIELSAPPHMIMAQPTASAEPQIQPEEPSASIRRTPGTDDATQPPPAKRARTAASAKKPAKTKKTAAQKQQQPPKAANGSAAGKTKKAHAVNNNRSDSEASDAENNAGNSASNDDSTPADDEKRRQFLERNRIAALKCRQRKKKQLKELQDRHDYMSEQNNKLRAEYMQMRERSLHLRALLAAHRECLVAQGNGVFGVDNLPISTPTVSLQPLMFGSASEGEHVKEIIAAIPPANNGVPMHSIDPTTGKPVVMPDAVPPQPVLVGTNPKVTAVTAVGPGAVASSTDIVAAAIAAANVPGMGAAVAPVVTQINPMQITAALPIVASPVSANPVTISHMTGAAAVPGILPYI